MPSPDIRVLTDFGQFYDIIYLYVLLLYTQCLYTVQHSPLLSFDLDTPAGYWRLLDPDYRDRVFQMVLTLLEEEDWSYKRVPLNATCEKLEELEPGLDIQ